MMSETLKANQKNRKYRKTKRSIEDASDSKSQFKAAAQFSSRAGNKIYQSLHD